MGSCWRPMAGQVTDDRVRHGPANLRSSRFTVQRLLANGASY